MKNTAVYMKGINKLESREVKMPIPDDNEVLVKIEYVGICGSDVHYLEHGRIGDFVVEDDFVLGHECAGTIVQIGNNVKALKVGDKVTLEPGIPCGKCRLCREGKYNLCPDVKFLATPPYNGAFTNYLAYPQDMVFKLPDNISTREGALIEPLSVGIHAANQGNVKLGNTVVILGAGSIGLVTLLACKAKGAGNIIVTDVIPKRLDFAKKLGATHVINAANEDVLAKIAQVGPYDGADVVIEAAGTAQTVQITTDLVRPAGNIVLVGMASQDIIGLNVLQIMVKEAQINPIFRYRNIYPVAINAVAAGIINISEIVSHEFEFNQIHKAFDYVINNKDEVIKAIIKME